MKPKKRQKLCSNCDGEIDLDVIVCPYCAADLREEKPEQHPAPAAVRPLAGGQQMSQSLYPPQYSSQETPDQPSIVTEAPAAEVSAPASPVEKEKTNSLVAPILLLTLGAQLFLLGALLVFLSSHGSLVLKWDARLWFLYIFAAVPCLIFGYRAFSKIE